MNRQQIFALCFFGVLLALLYQMGLMFRPFVFPVLWAVILAHLCFPLHIRLTALVGRTGVAFGCAPDIGCAGPGRGAAGGAECNAGEGGRIR
jgi:hypothetical protein